MNNLDELEMVCKLKLVEGSSVESLKCEFKPNTIFEQRYGMTLEEYIDGFYY